MKLRVISLMAFLFAGNVAAQEVHLFCSGTYQAVDEFGAVSSPAISREFKFDEQANTAAITNGFGDWKKLKDVEFSEGEIYGKQTGNLYTWGKSYEMKLNRYTGILNITIISAVMQCEVIEKKEKLF
jgi:hypothetical protein